MKRSTEQQGEDMLHDAAMANYLMLLSQSVIKTEVMTAKTHSDPDHVFECKTCSRQFTSFQALGGHRASHKKLKPSPTDVVVRSDKVHECTICRLRFGTGQALGGHMRKHRGVDRLAKSPKVLKRMNSSRRIMCLDLNLTPLENDFEFIFGRFAAKMNNHL